MVRRCDTCAFFDVIVVDDADDVSFPDSICRRFPPAGGEWPVVLADDWCGEWTAKEVTDARNR